MEAQMMTIVILKNIPMIPITMVYHIILIPKLRAVWQGTTWYVRKNNFFNK